MLYNFDLLTSFHPRWTGWKAVLSFDSIPLKTLSTVVVGKRAFTALLVVPKCAIIVFVNGCSTVKCFFSMPLPASWYCRYLCAGCEAWWRGSLERNPFLQFFQSLVTPIELWLVCSGAFSRPNAIQNLLDRITISEISGRLQVAKSPLSMSHVRPKLFERLRLHRKRTVDSSCQYSFNSCKNIWPEPIERHKKKCHRYNPSFGQVQKTIF